MQEDTSPQQMSRGTRILLGAIGGAVIGGALWYWASIIQTEDLRKAYAERLEDRNWVVERANATGQWSRTLTIHHLNECQGLSANLRLELKNHGFNKVMCIDDRGQHPTDL